MAVTGALEGSNLGGRPEKDDFIGSRGYPTVLASAGISSAELLLVSADGVVPLWPRGCVTACSTV